MINVEELKTGFLKKYQKEGEYYIDTGGRFEICGNHTDHNHAVENKYRFFSFGDAMFIYGNYDYLDKD